MKISKNENKIKTVFNLYEPLILIMNSKCDKAFLKRDAYLDSALRSEARFLREGVTTPNSDKAKSYIAKNLKELKLKPLNLLLSTETVDLMNEVCKEKNIPRDAFINHIFLLMIANDTLINVLFFKLYKHLENLKKPCYSDPDPGDFDDALYEWGTNDDFRYELGVGHYWQDPNILDSINALVKLPPLWRLQTFFLGIYNFNFYNYTFERNALNNLPSQYGPLKAENSIGFNVFMSDEEVSKQESESKVVNSQVARDVLLTTLMQNKLKPKSESGEKEKSTPKVETKIAEATGEFQ